MTYVIAHYLSGTTTFDIDPDLPLEPQLLLYLGKQILRARLVYKFTTPEGVVLWKKYLDDPEMPWEPLHPRTLPTWSPPEEIFPFSGEEPGS